MRRVLVCFFLVVYSILPAAPYCQAAGLRAGDILVGDFGLDAVVRVDPTTGDRTILSGAGRGAGLGIRSPRGIVVSDRGELYVTDAERAALFSIDPETGDRTIVSRASVGLGPEFFAPFAMALGKDNDLYLTDLTLDAVFHIDLDTGNRTILADATTGSGPVLGNPTAIALLDDQRLVVGDQRLDAVVAIDLATGERSILSDANTGFGPNFASPLAFAPGPFGQFYATDNSQLLLLVDPETGDRLTVSGGFLGLGTAFSDLRGVARDLDGSLLVTDEDLAAVLRVNPFSGNRTIFSALGTGDGPAWQTIEAIAIVPQIVPEPAGAALAAVGMTWLLTRRRA